jgi:hypothetical protein
MTHISPNADNDMPARMPSPVRPTSFIRSASASKRLAASDASNSKFSTSLELDALTELVISVSAGPPSACARW